MNIHNSFIRYRNAHQKLAYDSSLCIHSTIISNFTLHSISLSYSGMVTIIGGSSLTHRQYRGLPNMLKLAITGDHDVHSTRSDVKQTPEKDQIYQGLPQQTLEVSL